MLKKKFDTFVNSFTNLQRYMKSGTIGSRFPFNQRFLWFIKDIDAHSLNNMAVLGDCREQIHKTRNQRKKNFTKNVIVFLLNKFISINRKGVQFCFSFPIGRHPFPVYHYLRLLGVPHYRANYSTISMVQL